MEPSKADIKSALHHRGDEPHLLREVLRTYQALMSGFARETGMPASRFALMRILANTEGDVGVTDLARRLGINPAAVTRQVQELERDGLIQRRSDRKDGRRSYIALSPEGLKQFGKVHARSHELEEALERVLGVDEMLSAAETLTRLREFVEGRR